MYKDFLHYLFLILINDILENENFIFKIHNLFIYNSFFFHIFFNIFCVCVYI